MHRNQPPVRVLPPVDGLLLFPYNRKCIGKSHLSSGPWSNYALEKKKTLRASTLTSCFDPWFLTHSWGQHNMGVNTIIFK